MFKTLFELIKSINVQLNIGFALEGSNSPYISINPVFITVDSYSSTLELTLNYLFQFKIHAEKKSVRKKLENELIEILKGFSNTSVSNAQVSKIVRYEIRPQFFITELNFQFYTHYEKNDTYDLLVGTGKEIDYALFDIYKQSQLTPSIVFTDFVLETNNYPYIALTSLTEININDRSCESVFDSNYELVIISQKFNEIEPLIFKLIDLMHNAKLNCENYNVEQFSFTHVLFNEIRPQFWQAHLFFDFTRND